MKDSSLEWLQLFSGSNGRFSPSLYHDLHLLQAMALLSPAAGWEKLEVYNKNDFGSLGSRTTSNRAASTTPSNEPVYVPIEGLEPSQHGFMLVSPNHPSQRQLNKEVLSETQIETIRKQEEFLKSVKEANDARRNQPTVTAVGRQIPISDNSARILTTGVNERRLFALDNSRNRDSTAQLPTNLQVPRKLDAPKIEGNIFNGFQPDSYLSSRYNSGLLATKTDGSISQPNVARPSFLFRETPEEVANVPFSSERISTRTKSVVEPRLKDQIFFEPEVDNFSSNRQTFATKSTGDKKALGRPISAGLSGELRKRPAIVNPAPNRFQFNGQTSDDEESEFISQVNQNTAAFVSQHGFAQGERNFETVLPQKPATPLRTKQPSFDSVGAQLNNDHSSRKPVGSKTRPRVETQRYDELSVPTAPLLQTFNRNPPPTRFQNKDETEEIIDRELESRKQAETAQYSFASDISDTVNGNSQSRQEVRDGLKLTGMYSYSDGFFKRTVHYEADENGYRIVKEENEPIGNGPKFDPNGEIEVNYNHAGSSLSYKIRGDQLRPKTLSNGRDPQTRTDSLSDQLELPS